MSQLIYKKKVWVTWERQRRSIELADVFGCNLLLHVDNSNNRLLRYLSSSFHTLKYLLKSKPDLVFCQNPSMFLALFLGIIKAPLGFILVVDRHSNFMFGRETNFLSSLHRVASDISIKLAHATIVTNNGINDTYLEPLGRIAMILPDRLPNISTEQKLELRANSILFITSFASDEPIENVLEALAGMPDDIYVYITGNFKKFGPELQQKGRNYECTGFVSEDMFKALLASVDAVMVLTNHEYTLTCGAYEGVAAGKPLVLSNTKTIRSYFTCGATYCDPSPESIRSALNECLQNLPHLQEEVLRLKHQLTISWDAAYEEVISCLNHLSNKER